MPRTRWKNLRLIALAVLLGLSPAATALADAQLDRRVVMGLRLFPAFLAADLDIDGKRIGDGRLLLLVVYKDDLMAAETLAKRLRALGDVKEMPLRVDVVPFNSLDAYDGVPVGGAFIAEWVEELTPLVFAFGRERGVIVLSPFPGDVERGALGGVFVGDRILPYVNVEVMESSGLRLRPFFLEVAKRYE